MLAVLVAISVFAIFLYLFGEREGLPAPLRWVMVGVFLFFSVGGTLGLVG